MRACVRVCVRACVFVFARVCVCAYVHVCVFAVLCSFFWYVFVLLFVLFYTTTLQKRFNINDTGNDNTLLPVKIVLLRIPVNPCSRTRTNNCVLQGDPVCPVGEFT